MLAQTRANDYLILKLRDPWLQSLAGHVPPAGFLDEAKPILDKLLPTRKVVIQPREDGSVHKWTPYVGTLRTRGRLTL